jgi:hypothetical protein
MFNVKPKGKAPGLPPPPVPAQQKKPATLFNNDDDDEEEDSGFGFKPKAQVPPPK